MKISSGIKENGIIIGNIYNKYGSRNPFVKKVIENFEYSLMELVELAKPQTIHEVGCGEGYWTIKWHLSGYKVRGSDFSKTVIELAQNNAGNAGIKDSLFYQKSIYDLNKAEDSADLIVACEVFEHLENPRRALEAILKACPGYLIASVPREPLWRMLNMARGKYLSDMGNTPGHLQNWSMNEFVEFLAEKFEVVRVSRPLPWSMVLCRNANDC